MVVNLLSKDGKTFGHITVESSNLEPDGCRVTVIRNLRGKLWEIDISREGRETRTTFALFDSAPGDNFKGAWNVVRLLLFGQELYAFSKE